MEQNDEELEHLILPTYEKINAEYQGEISEVTEGYDNFKKAITKQGEEWHKIVDIVIRKHLKKAEEMETTDVAILQKAQSEIQKIQTSAQDIVQENKRSLQSNDTNKIINFTSRNTELRKVPDKTELFPPSFFPGKISEEIIRKMFGNVKPSIKTEIPVKRFIDQPKSEEIDSGFNNPYRVCCVPDTEKLYVRGGSSSTLTQLDNKGKLLNKVKTKSGNTDHINMSVMRDGRLVYSDHDDRSINIVNSVRIDTVIRLQGWKPLAVCCTSTNDLLVPMRSDDHRNSKVVRYSESTITQEIQCDDQDKALYSDPRYIVENRNLDICVTNWRVGRGVGVVVVDKAGKLKFNYQGNHRVRKSGNFNPCGLDTDSQCHILVSDNYNHCVHILNHDGSFVRYIDNCSLEGPYDLSISSNDVLYVVDKKKKVKVIRYLQCIL